jgi:organic hydroperoxide reductase OsmC/OhrA
MAHTHEYEVLCAWAGLRGLGNEQDDRTHDVNTVPPTLEARVSADSAFPGNASLVNPEQLIVMAAASCQLLSFLAVAARSRIDVVAYEDNAVGYMPEDDLPVRLSRIELRPSITFGTPVAVDRIQRLVELAHQECYVANSLRTEVIVIPTIIGSG